MISIRKYLDSQDVAVAAARTTAPNAAFIGSNSFSACLDGYRGMLRGVGHAAVDACPALGHALEANLASVAKSLDQMPSAEAIASADENATAEVLNWGRASARHYRQKAAEVTLTYTQTGVNAWSYSIAVPAAHTGGISTPVTGTMTFDASGNLATVNGSAVGTGAGQVSRDQANPLAMTWKLLGGQAHYHAGDYCIQLHTWLGLRCLRNQPGWLR